MPIAMKVTVETSERGDSRLKPHTPWPLVHPVPMRVPTTDQDAAEQRGDRSEVAPMYSAGPEG
jgi:hypothetical protein